MERVLQKIEYLRSLPESTRRQLLGVSVVGASLVVAALWFLGLRWQFTSPAVESTTVAQIETSTLPGVFESLRHGNETMKQELRAALRSILLGNQDPTETGGGNLQGPTSPTPTDGETRPRLPSR